jgi:orotate phosphoribosyltransferase
VEDVVTLGGRVKETISIAKAAGADILAVAMLVDRSSGTVDLGVPTFSLIQMNIETFPADRLPPELAAVPAIKPGSK